VLEEAPNDDIEDRREEHAEESDTQHAGKNGGADLDAHFGAGAVREHERDDPEGEGQGSHQDGAKAQA